MNIVYCGEWSNIRKKPNKILSIEDAIHRSEKGEPYAAVIYENNFLVRVISIDKEAYSVVFYDENQVPYLFYDFKKLNNQLFLYMVYHYEYREEKIIQHTFFRFEEDGKMFTERMDYLTNEVVEKEGNVDVSSNWEQIPSFGNYSSIMRKDR